LARSGLSTKTIKKMGFVYYFLDGQWWCTKIDAADDAMVVL
jgi:hypothetical protein